jgi:hypothetical protein
MNRPSMASSKRDILGLASVFGGLKPGGVRGRERQESAAGIKGVLAPGGGRRDSMWSSEVDEAGTQGWLGKLPSGSKHGKGANFQQRYFEITSYYLKYYPERFPRIEKTMKGIFDLRLLDAVEGLGDDAMRLLFAGGTELVLKARSAESASHWIECLRNHCVQQDGGAGAGTRPNESDAASSQPGAESAPPPPAPELAKNMSLDSEGSPGGQLARSASPVMQQAVQDDAGADNSNGAGDGAGDGAAARCDGGSGDGGRGDVHRSSDVAELAGSSFKGGAGAGQSAVGGPSAVAGEPENRPGRTGR